MAEDEGRDLRVEVAKDLKHIAGAVQDLMGKVDLLAPLGGISTSAPRHVKRQAAAARRRAATVRRTAAGGLERATRAGGEAGATLPHRRWPALIAVMAVVLGVAVARSRGAAT